MAHVRKDTLTRTVQWWKHLRDWKRIQQKRERVAAKKQIRRQIETPSGAHP